MTVRAGWGKEQTGWERKSILSRGKRRKKVPALEEQQGSLGLNSECSCAIGKASGETAVSRVRCLASGTWTRLQRSPSPA